MTLRPSFTLWRMQLLIHLLLALCLFLVLLPFLFINLVWIGVWLMSLGLLSISIRHCYERLHVSLRRLMFTERGWSLTDDRGEHELDLVDEVVVWSWLIVLRYREKTRPGGFSLVLLPDSATAQELRRLRVWVRTQNLSPVC